MVMQNSFLKCVEFKWMSSIQICFILWLLSMCSTIFAHVSFGEVESKENLFIVPFIGLYLICHLQFLIFKSLMV